MTAYDLRIIDPADLKEITLVCKCGARLTLPFNKGIPEYCPGCKAQFDKATQDVFLKFEGLHAAIQLSGNVKFEFPIRKLA
jgi:hypothetical protein